MPSHSEGASKIEQQAPRPTGHSGQRTQVGRVAPSRGGVGVQVNRKHSGGIFHWADPQRCRRWSHSVGEPAGAALSPAHSSWSQNDGAEEGATHCRSCGCRPRERLKTTRTLAGDRRGPAQWSSLHDGREGSGREASPGYWAERRKEGANGARGRGQSVSRGTSCPWEGSQATGPLHFTPLEPSALYTYFKDNVKPNKQQGIPAQCPACGKGAAVPLG